MPIMPLVSVRRRLPKPSSEASVRLELENSLAISGRLASALSSLVLLTVRLPSCCISGRCPTAARRPRAPLLEPSSERSWFCTPTIELSPCSTPAFLVVASYLVSVLMSAASASRRWRSPRSSSSASRCRRRPTPWGIDGLGVERQRHAVEHIGQRVASPGIGRLLMVALASEAACESVARRYRCPRRRRGRPAPCR